MPIYAHIRLRLARGDGRGEGVCPKPAQECTSVYFLSGRFFSKFMSSAPFGTFPPGRATLHSKETYGAVHSHCMQRCIVWKCMGRTFCTGIARPSGQRPLPRPILPNARSQPCRGDMRTLNMGPEDRTEQEKMNNP